MKCTIHVKNITVSPKRYLLITAICVAAISLFVCFKHNLKHETQPPPDGSLTQAAHNPLNPARDDSTKTSSSSHKVKNESARSLHIPFRHHDSSSDSKDIIQGEWQLRFSSSTELDKFIREIEGMDGVSVLDTNYALGMLRIACRDGAMLERIMATTRARPVEAGANHWFKAPFVSPAPSGNAITPYLMPVNTGTLSALGLNTPDALWGKDVTVALVDSGISGTVLIDPSRIISIDLVGSPQGQNELSPHGSIMASVIAGESEITPGIAPDVSFVDIRVLDAEAKGDGFTIARGIIAAVESGADIINLSLGGMGDDMAVSRAVQYALDSGVTVVAAAGNSGSNQTAYPARYPGVIAVAATDAAGQHASFSNTGDEIDLSAPGYGVITELANGLYVRANGTSVAAALVTGAIAGIMSEESVSSTEAVGLVMYYSNDSGQPGQDPEFGIGLVNLQRIRDRYQEYTDLAVGGYFWEDTEEDAEGHNKQLAVTVQNQGTLTAWYLTVMVNINGAASSYFIDSLAPGESTSVSTWFTMQELEETGAARIEIEVWSSDHDGNPENNTVTYFLSVK